MQSFSIRASKLLDGQASPEAIFSLACDMRTATELELIEALVRSNNIQPATGFSANQQYLAARLLGNKKVRIAFINDNGFYAGAGIATARQARSFALAGHTVSVVGLNPYPVTALACQRYRAWLKNEGSTTAINFHAANRSDGTNGRSGQRDHTPFISSLLDQEKWDLVVLGNLHSDAISLRFLDPLLQRQIPIIWFAHDLDLLGGGCGYPQYYNCKEHLNGCLDTNCPKPTEAYPQSANGRVQATYLHRSLLIEYTNVQVACQSHWSQLQLSERYPQRPVMRIPLGVDTTIFHPIKDRGALRQSLGLDPDLFTVVVGADSIGRPGKGGDILQYLIPKLLQDPGFQVVCFGHYPESNPHMVSCGYLDREIDIARIYASGDCFLNPVTIEAFGQTIIEATSCGCIPVALRRAGVIDIVEHGRTGLLVDEPEELLGAINHLRQDTELRNDLAAEGRERIEHQFSLQRQYVNWLKTLCKEWAVPRSLSATMDDISVAHQAQVQPLISVVSTTLNCEEELATTASSLRMQNHPSFEWVVQDGGSTDGSLEVVETSGVAYNIQQGSDKGIYDAANKAARHCKGEWVLFLQAGDWLAGPNALIQVMNSVNHTEADLIVADFIEILIDGTPLRRHPANPAHKLQALRDGRFRRAGSHWLSGMPSHQGLILRRSWLERFPFNTELRISADWMQMFSVIDAGARISMSDELLSWYPNGGYSFDHSDQWIADVITIAKHFQPSHQAVDNYFAKALDEHNGTCLNRRNRRLALQRRYP